MEIATIESLISHWKKSNVYSPSKEPFLLDYRLGNKGIKLPEDFKYLYQFVGGTTDLDDEMFFFFAPDELTTMGAKFSLGNADPFRDIVIFIDYMHASWWYGFRVTDDGYEIGIIPMENKFKVITNSLTDFINLYISDSEILYDYE
jgi:hypothetical protein